MFRLLRYENTQKKIMVLVFVMMILGYIGLEIYFNYRLLEQMSTQTSAYEIKNIENWGRILTGIGLALFLAKASLKDAEEHAGTMLIRFATACVFTITLSFFLQWLLVKCIVSSASLENKSKALLITQASNTIVPYYNDNDENHQVKELNLPKEYVQEQQERRKAKYFSKAEPCLQGKQFFQLETKLDRALFPYRTLIQPFDEERLKQPVIRFHDCMLAEQIVKVKTDKISLPSKNELKEQLYVTYKELNTAYQQEVNKLKRQLERREIFIPHARSIEKKQQQEWIRQSKLAFGAENEISPNYSREKFMNHPEINTYVEKLIQQKKQEKQKIKDIKQQAFEQQKVELFAFYNQHRQFIADLNVDIDENIKIREEDVKLTEQSYKAMVMPMVALSLSLFFVSLNFISFISLILFYSRPVWGKAFVLLGMCTVLALPVLKPLKSIQSEVQEVNSTQSIGRVSQYVLTAVEYYQTIILKLYR